MPWKSSIFKSMSPSGLEAMDGVISVFVRGETKENVGVFGIDASQIGNSRGQNFFLRVIRLLGGTNDDAPFDIFLEKNIRMLW